MSKKTLLKPNTILMDKATGEILLITNVSNLWGEDAYVIMLEVGEGQITSFAFVKPNTKYTNYEHIGDL